MAVAPDPEQGYLRICMTFATPLNQDEVEYFQQTRLNFKREAHIGTARGFELVIWILRKVILVHGGRIGIFPDDNAVMYIDLPYRRADVDGTVHWTELETLQTNLLRRRSWSTQVAQVCGGISPRRSEGEVMKMQRKCMKVLVVDDSKANRKMLRRLMESEGHVCTEAVDGREAVDWVQLSLANNEPYDFVLLDNEMPVLKGRDAVKEMRRLGFTNPVLGVTGNALQEDIEDFVANGVNVVVLKPLTAFKFKEAMIDLGIYDPKNEDE